MADTTFTAVDLSRLPAPPVIEALSYEAILADTLATLRQIDPNFDAIIASDPAVKILQVGAYREMLIRARYNDAARAVMPAYATGADLDNLAALMGVARLLLAPATLTDDAVYETDTDLRCRLVLTPEGYSVAGPEGAYIYHALTGAPAVLDASATSPAPGEVLVTILARAGDGSASPALVAQVAESEQLLAELCTRHRVAGVDTVLVTKVGIPWGSPASFTRTFSEVRNLARIVQPGVERLGIPDRAKHLHDLRGTFVTYLCRKGLSDQEIVGIVGIVAWSPASVAQIRRTYVDDAAVVVALSERIRRSL